MERQLLSREDSRQGDAAVLRAAARYGGDQQHVLPHAGRENRPRLERGDAGAIQIDFEGAEADHTRGKVAGLRGCGKPLSAGGRDAGSETWRTTVSTAALSPQEPRAARWISGDTAVRRVR